MSQVGISSRLSQQSLGSGPKLPEIQHPLSRLGRPDGLDVRGTSRLGTAEGLRPASQASLSGRPLAAEGGYNALRRSLPSSGGRSASRASAVMRNMDATPLRYDAIPEGVEVIAGDETKARLPIFGEYPFPPLLPVS